MAEGGSPTDGARWQPVASRYVFALPVVLFGILALALAWGLSRNAADLPSALIGKPIPDFELPPVQGRSPGLASADLYGEVSIVNVFASWCTPCRAEHPLLLGLAKTSVVPVHGLNYKDRPDEAAKWLDELGDPYTRTGADLDGRVAIDWGVYGVPETFVVNADGYIVHKHVGPMTPDVLAATLMPLVKKLQEQMKEPR